MSHHAQALRAGGGFPGWIAACDCGWCPDVVHDDAQAAAMAAAAHVLDNRPTETTDGA